MERRWTGAGWAARVFLLRAPCTEYTHKQRRERKKVRAVSSFTLIIKFVCPHPVHSCTHTHTVCLAFTNFHTQGTVEYITHPAHRSFILQWRVTKFDKTSPTYFKVATCEFHLCIRMCLVIRVCTFSFSLNFLLLLPNQPTV